VLRKSICVKLSDRLENNLIIDKSGRKENVVTKIVKKIKRGFGHVERMDK
jgi:hypothetical protein